MILASACVKHSLESGFHSSAKTCLHPKIGEQAKETSRALLGLFSILATRAKSR